MMCKVSLLVLLVCISCNLSNAWKRIIPTPSTYHLKQRHHALYHSRSYSLKGEVKDNLRVDLPQNLLIQQAVHELRDLFHAIDLQTMSTLNTILQLYQEEKVDTLAFHGVNGYGYGDVGREKFDNIIAKLLGAEQALVRLQFFSGTHAISTALFAILRPGDVMLGVSGKPYDTLEEVIGLRENSQCGNTKGSLKDWGISYQEVDLQFEDMNTHELVEKSHDRLAYTNAKFDLKKIEETLNANQNIKVLHIQRSCGYQWRPSIKIAEIKRLVDFIDEKFRSKGRDIIIFCDNCYGELVEPYEPTHVGVDIIAGSLIKNLGGTLAPCGGYIAGRADLVNQAATHLSAPGVEGGATFNQYQYLFQGLFMAPSIVGESLKGAHLLSYIMETQYGFACNPPAKVPRTDIIQAVRLEDRQRLISFCESVQKKSPVGSYIRPFPGMTSGYGTEVIFADGTFIEGSTLELSADGPLREPFVAYSQGCTHWTHWAIVLEEVLKSKGFQRS